VDSAFQLVAVAFLHTAGGRMRVLLAIDRDGEQLHGGEPALLVEHRPGRSPAELVVDCADAVPDAAVELVTGHAPALARLVEDACDEFGQLVGERLLGTGITIHGARESFGG
jgi:hypothetical protein